MFRRYARIVGGALCLLGALAIAWAALTFFWQDPFTAAYTRWEQRRLNHELQSRAAAFQSSLPRTSTDHGTPAPNLPPLRRLAAQFRQQSDQGAPIARIRIPRLGLNMVVVNGTDHESLKQGPGRDRRTFMPGEGQLVYIAGHRTTYGAPFARIDALRTGDPIELKMPYATFTYRVTNHIIVPADDLNRLNSTGEELLALQACHPRFSARQRYIVYAKPVAVVRITNGRRSANEAK